MPRPPSELDTTTKFNALYRAHANSVFAYLRSRADRDVAYDVLEETFLVAWRRLDDLPDEPRAWLVTTARRSLANERRAAARRTSLGLRVIAERAIDVVAGDPAETVVARDAIAAAFRSLSERDRDLLALVSWAELSPSDAARIVGCSRAALLVRLHRARRRFEEAVALLDVDDASDSLVRLSLTASAQECIS